jgi:hypothetical protein
MKRNATLEQIQHTASQVVGSSVEAATSGGTMLVDQQLGHQHAYPRGTIVSPRYTNAQLTPQHSHHAHISPQMDPAAQGGMDHSYANAYPGIQPRRNTTEGRNLPRGNLAEVHPTPQSSQRHRGSGTTGIGLSNVQGVVAGTPRRTPRGTPRVGTDPARRFLDPPQPQKAPVRFSGVGLGPGLGSSRQGVSGMGSANYGSFSVPSISSRGT